MDEEAEYECKHKLENTLIDYPLIYVDILGCHVAGIVMSFIISYLDGHKKEYFRITDKALGDCLGLNLKKFRAAKVKILASGIISAKVARNNGNAVVTHYMFNKQKHVEAVNSVKL